MRNAYTALVRKPEGKKIPLRKHGCRWEDNRMNVRGIGCDVVD
jgi:hypothetical protein